MLDQGSVSKPLHLVKDGDLISLIQHMIRVRGPEPVLVTKVKGHATDADVEQGRVRAEYKFGNDEADTAADLGWRHQSETITDARRVLLNAREFWCPIVLQLHRFMVAIVQASVNHWPQTTKDESRHHHRVEAQPTWPYLTGRTPETGITKEGALKEHHPG